MGVEGWVREFPAAITVCDTEGVLLAMNERAVATFESDGGEALLGTNLLACHPEPARTKIVEMLKAGSPNIYTIQKGGIKKLIYQSPWFVEGTYAGFVELSLPVPQDMPHFNRDTPTDSNKGPLA
jgi:hypothetical protein